MRLALTRGQWATAAALAALVVITAGALADGLLWGVVAFERDTVVFYYPLAAWSWQQLHALGQIPLWTPQIYGGYPIFADGEHGLASPIVLAAMLAFSPEGALIALRVFHLVIAAVGGYALARTWQLSRTASVLAGLTFALGSFFSAQIHHENVVRSAVWLPLILACLERALRASGRRRVRWLLLSAACLGLAALGLHAQILLMDLLVIAAYGVLRWAIGPIRGAGRHVWHRAGILVLLLPVVPAVGLALAAVQILPFFQLAGISWRGAGLPYNVAASHSLTPFGLIQPIFPFFFRGPGDKDWSLWSPWESALYVGLVPLVLALVAILCSRRPAVRFWSILGLLGLVLALGQYSPFNLHHALWLMPGLSGLRAPGRFTMIVVLALAMLAAHGLDWLERQARGAEPLPNAALRLFRGLIFLPLILTPILLVSNVVLVNWPETTTAFLEAVYLSVPRDASPLWSADVHRGMMAATSLVNPRTVLPLLGMVLVGGALLVWQGPWRPALRHWRGWSSLLVAFAAIDLLVYAWHIHPRLPLNEVTAPHPAAAALAERASSSSTGVSPFRVLVTPGVADFAANQLAPLGLQEANGYTSLQPSRHQFYLRRVLHVDDDLLDAWNIRYLIEPAWLPGVSTFEGVDYAAAQAVMNTPAGGAMAEETFEAPANTPIAEIRMITSLVNGIPVPHRAPVAEINLRGPRNELLMTRTLYAGVDTMEWAWRHPEVDYKVEHGHVLDAGGEVLPIGPPGIDRRELSLSRIRVDPAVTPTTIQIRSLTPTGELVVHGVALFDTAGQASQLLGRHKTKFDELYRDDSIAIYENADAFPRAFFVSHARAMLEDATELDLMETQPFNPAEEVVLPGIEPLAEETLDTEDQRAIEQMRLGRRPPLAARVESYTPDRVVVRATAPNDGYLVLTDSFFQGWKAFVDGREQPILNGDLLFRVVELTEGDHVVEFRFEPTSVRRGVQVSAVAAAVLLGLLIWTFLPRTVRSARRPPAQIPEKHERPPAFSGR